MWGRCWRLRRRGYEVVPDADVCPQFGFFSLMANKAFNVRAQVGITYLNDQRLITSMV